MKDGWLLSFQEIAAQPLIPRHTAVHAARVVALGCRAPFGAGRGPRPLYGSAVLRHWRLASGPDMLSTVGKLVGANVGDTVGEEERVGANVSPGRVGRAVGLTVGAPVGAGEQSGAQRGATGCQ